MMITVIYVSVKRKTIARERRQLEDHLEIMELQLKKMTAENHGISVGDDVVTQFDADIKLSYGDDSYFEGSQEGLEISEIASLLGEMRNG